VGFSLGRELTNASGSMSAFGQWRPPQACGSGAIAPNCCMTE
jgi:hypothetical protein